MLIFKDALLYQIPVIQSLRVSVSVNTKDEDPKVFSLDPAPDPTLIRHEKYIYIYFLGR